MNDNLVIELFPSSLKGNVKIPPSKSLSHRALICAALSAGETKITNFMYSDDTTATINALKQIGAKFAKQGDNLIINGVSRIKLKSKVVDCNESGSTIRFLIPLMSLSNKEVRFTGKESLISRPQSIYKDIFDEDDNLFKVTDNEIVVKGSIKAREYKLKGNISSQFFTGLMFTLPLLEEDSVIYVAGNLESKSYIDLTIAVLEHFNIEIKEIENGYFIEGGQTYKAKDYHIEGDYSQAAFFLVGGLISGLVTVDDLEQESSQGDKEIIDIIQEMKGKIIFAENGFTTELSDTTSSVIDLSNSPDLGPIVALLAAVSNGKTRITNIKRLRLKESDRIESTVQTLKALGADIKVVDDEIIVIGRKSLKGDVTLDSYNDHRIAMMISIAATICEKPIKLTNANAINKSYPHFYKDYKQLGGKIK